jgi:hypothetical protein
MMQRHARATNFINKRFTARLKFVQIRWAKWLIGRAGKN